MPTCKECGRFFPLDDNPVKGDCVERVVDPRQSYYTAKVVDAGMDSSACRSFQKKTRAGARAKT
jgi:benzylsuccinate synthase